MRMRVWLVAVVGTAGLAVAGFACGGGSSSGVSDIEIVSDFYRGDPTDDEKAVQVPCPGGKKALGGGFELAAGDFPVDVQFSEPMGQLGQAPTGWSGFAMEKPPLDPADEWSFDVFAICAKVTP
jgi:hypothetical protein